MQVKPLWYKGFTMGFNLNYKFYKHLSSKVFAVGLSGFNLNYKFYKLIRPTKDN